ncbi:UNVERIFIED_CONTAM: hypothetical protein Slati_2739700 [Sesamum latifolium]|uniref:Reverse transcriptase domain-containing protein n=1 Tax=Sesamum latifolium TaxID=2727402 RepID=A0AAW2VYH7_9LAMI
MRKIGEKGEPPTAGIIGVTSGGPASGDSMRARKTTIREADNVANHVAFSEVMATQYKNPESEIIFNNQDLEGRFPANNDTIVIAATVSNFWVKKILFDSGSSTDILFYRAFSQMGIDNERLTPVNTPLASFSGDVVEPLGEVLLPVSLGSHPRQATTFIKFLVVDSPSAYNMILGRPSLNLLQAITLKSESQKRLHKTTLGKSREETPQDEAGGKPREGNKRRKFEEECMEAIEEVKMVEFFGDPSKIVKIGSLLDPPFEHVLIKFLQDHFDVFAWEASDMQGISPEVMVHRLNVNPKARPIK